MIKFITKINNIIGDKIPFTIDVRYPKGKVTVVLIFKSKINGLSFEPLVLSDTEENIDSVFEAKVREHYDKIKEDYSDVDKFLGAKTAKESAAIEEKVETAENQQVTYEEDLDF